MSFFTDRVHRIPRVWSNRELSQVAHLFDGDVVNVSAWKDDDKEGQHYRDYFRNATSYTITNFDSKKRGFQGQDGEIYLDLEAELPLDLRHRFDAVFNHTTLEHVFDIQRAFANLCEMSRDAVIVVIPFLQQYHSKYGDYWRLTPLAIKRLLENQKFELVYQNFNRHRASSVYTFTIASCRPAKWKARFPDWTFNYRDPSIRGREPYVGCRAIANRGFRIRNFLEQKLGMRFGHQKHRAAKLG